MNPLEYILQLYKRQQEEGFEETCGQFDMITSDPRPSYADVVSKFQTFAFTPLGLYVIYEGIEAIVEGNSNLGKGGIILGLYLVIRGALRIPQQIQRYRNFSERE